MVPSRLHFHVTQAFTAVDNKTPVQADVVNKFKQDPVHAALAKCSEMRPSVDVSVGGEGSKVGIGAGGARVEYRSSVAKA
jgi:ketol-acid reductoisomerase